MSATLTMNPAVHRKPLPGRAPPASPGAYSVPPQVPQQARYSPQQPPQQQYQQRPRGDTQSTMATSTSSMLDHRVSPMYSYTAGAAPTQQYGQEPTRRTLSNATSSTSSSATNTGLQRAPTNASAGPRRSTSSRSNSSVSPTSYVALMRKQKATVWCDRAQSEDPRILAAQRAAKTRAVMEVAGGSHRITGSGQQQGSVGIRSKIRHHGAPKAAAYTGTYISSGGVPMRLSASEVDDGNDSDEEDSRYMNYHRRDGSARSSLGSRNNSYLNSGHNGLSNGSTPPSGNGHSPIEGIHEEETPMPNALPASDYFEQAGGQSGAGSPGSEEERRFGGVGGLPQRELTIEEQVKRTDDLRRRGSVDDRTMTLSTGRLFVANPDLSD